MLHDNARQQTPAHSVESLRQVTFQVLKHSPYSPDLAPSDYHSFGPFKDTLRGRHFGSDYDVKEAAHAWLVANEKNYKTEACGPME
jgi:hypothetical protein